MQKAKSKMQKIVSQRALALAISCALFSPSMVRADGGRLQSSQRCGEFQVSVFTSPAMPSAGPLDISVLVQDPTSGRVRDDANVSVELEQIDPSSKSAPIRFQQTATSAAATNKLFQAALFDLPAAGRWRASVTVENRPVPCFEMTVGDASPPWLEIAPWIAWPLVVISLFAVHQWILKPNCRCANEPAFS